MTRHMNPRVRNRIGIGVVIAVLSFSIAAGPDRVSAVAAGAKAARSCPGSNAPPRSETLAQTERTVLCLLNAERAARSLTALALDPRLQTAAERHAQDMGARDFFDHVTPEGTGVIARVRAAGFPSAGAKLAENLAWGSGRLGRPTMVVKNWMNSPPHRATILSPAMRQVGIGIALDAPEPDITGAVTYTADFVGETSGRTPRAQRRLSRRAR
jgi:uncharacterized protein YkwD